jgi:hypothetical protein
MVIQKVGPCCLKKIIGNDFMNQDHDISVFVRDGNNLKSFTIFSLSWDANYILGTAIQT